VTCECYQIGGPFIAEDPDCPIHGNAFDRADANDAARWRKLCQLHDGDDTLINVRGVDGEPIVQGGLNAYLDNY
jgi:hypothetical protein